MPRSKIKSILAFILLGLLIYTFRNAHGKPFEYLIAGVVVIFFWYLLGLRLGLSNLRNILILTFIFGTLVFIFHGIVPIRSPIANMGMLENFDLNPAQIGFLKESHEQALEIHLDHRPTMEQRYYKIGSLLYSSDGLHYSAKKQELDFSKFPKTLAWVNAYLEVNKLDDDTAKVKSWFVKSMTYSLYPGSLISSMPLDQFLFERRKGFCEHFAAALCTILHLKGYKSMVAFGYAGGTWNPIFKVLTFENADAHAWVEVFDPKINKYKIIDPTSWVFPEVSMGRIFGANYGWIFVAGVVFFYLFRFFLVRQGNAVEYFILKVSTLEKKHGLESKGCILSERISKIAPLEQALKKNMVNSLGIYLNMYNVDVSRLEQERALRKSLARW